MIPAKTICILLSGKAGVGKSTGAKFLKEIFFDKGLNKVEIFPFATGVKKTAKDSFGWNGTKDTKGRKLLQDVGRTGREYNEDIWCGTTFDKIIPSSQGYPFDVVLVDDWRYPNELNFVKKNFLYTVYPIRIESPERELLKGTELALDSSETSLPSASENSNFYFGTVYNVSSMEDYYRSMLALANTIFEKTTFWWKGE